MVSLFTFNFISYPRCCMSSMGAIVAAVPVAKASVNTPCLCDLTKKSTLNLNSLTSIPMCLAT